MTSHPWGTQWVVGRPTQCKSLSCTSYVAHGGEWTCGDGQGTNLHAAQYVCWVQTWGVVQIYCVVGDRPHKRTMGIAGTRLFLFLLLTPFTDLSFLALQTGAFFDKNTCFAKDENQKVLNLRHLPCNTKNSNLKNHF